MDFKDKSKRQRNCRGCGISFEWRRKQMICDKCHANEHKEHEMRKPPMDRVSEARSQAVHNRYYDYIKHIEVSYEDQKYPIQDDIFGPTIWHLGDAIVYQGGNKQFRLRVQRVFDSLHREDRIAAFIAVALHGTVFSPSPDLLNTLVWSPESKEAKEFTEHLDHVKTAQTTLSSAKSKTRRLAWLLSARTRNAMAAKDVKFAEVVAAEAKEHKYGPTPAHVPVPIPVAAVNPAMVAIMAQLAAMTQRAEEAEKKFAEIKASIPKTALELMHAQLDVITDATPTYSEFQSLLESTLEGEHLSIAVIRLLLTSRQVRESLINDNVVD